MPLIEYHFLVFFVVWVGSFRSLCRLYLLVLVGLVAAVFPFVGLKLVGVGVAVRLVVGGLSIRERMLG